MQFLILSLVLLHQTEEKSQCILLIDDTINSKCIIHELNCDFNSIGEEYYRYLAHIQEQINQHVKVVHYLDFDEINKYNLKNPKTYPAVRLGYYKEYEYFNPTSFGSTSYPLLSLKNIIEREYADDFLLKLNKKIQQRQCFYDREYHDNVIKYAINKNINVEADNFNVFDVIIKYDESKDFPKRKEIMYRKHSFDLYPWQEGYEPEILFLFKYEYKFD